MEWKDLPYRYRGAEIGGIVAGLGHFINSSYNDTMPAIHDVGSDIAALAFIGYMAGNLAQITREICRRDADP